MGGSSSVNPKYVSSPEAQQFAPQLLSYLQNILGQTQGGKNPLAGFDMASSPYAGAGDYIKSLIQGTDTPISNQPYVQQAQNTFSRDIAPTIKESLGANYGIRYGGPVADLLSRAGSDTATNLNAQLVGLQQQRNALRYGASQFGVATNQADTDRLLNAIFGGASTLGVGRGSSQMPAYAPNQNSQTLAALLSLAGTIGGAAVGGPGGAALGAGLGTAASGIGSSGASTGSFNQQYGGINDWYGKY